MLSICMYVLSLRNGIHTNVYFDYEVSENAYIHSNPILSRLVTIYALTSGIDLPSAYPSIDAYLWIRHHIRLLTFRVYYRAV